MSARKKQEHFFRVFRYYFKSKFLVIALENFGRTFENLFEFGLFPDDGFQQLFQSGYYKIASFLKFPNELHLFCSKGS